VTTTKKVEKFVVVMIDPNVGPSVDGILGFDLIKQSVVQIADGKPTFYNPEEFQSPESSYPLLSGQGGYFVTASFDRMSNKGIVRTFEIDTGSDVPAARTPSFDEHGVMAA